jgi:hypothetical protein
MLPLALFVPSVRSHTAHKFAQSATAANLLALSLEEYFGSHEQPESPAT